jgi:hypothetical protein
VEAGTLNVLLYFDIFSYPLTLEEIARMHPIRGITAGEVQAALERMVAAGAVTRQDAWYQVRPGDQWVQRRKAGNALASKMLPKAYRRSRFISRFPFVRAVMISGSLSKDYMEPASDIDFFVITQPGRLWIARTLLIGYKKLFLFNSHKEFCMNYFIDTAHLEIEDKNIFTATEVMFLLPTYHAELYRNFHTANAWAAAYYPNFGLKDTAPCAPVRDGWVKRAAEWFMGGALGERMDAWCLRRTLGRWRKKFSHFAQEKFEIALRSRKYVSKHHPSHFQERVIGKLEARQEEWEGKWGMDLRAVASSAQTMVEG